MKTIVQHYAEFGVTVIERSSY